MTKGRLKTDVIEWGHLVAIGYFARIQNGPFRQFRDAKRALLKPRVLLYFHLTIAFEAEEMVL